MFETRGADARLLQLYTRVALGEVALGEAALGALARDADGPTGARIAEACRAADGPSIV